MAINMKASRERATDSSLYSSAFSLSSSTSKLLHSRSQSKQKKSIFSRTDTLRQDPLSPDLTSQHNLHVRHHNRSVSSIQSSNLFAPSIPSNSAPQVGALQALLRDPLTFVPASHLTFQDEDKMVAVLRPRKIVRKNESITQSQQRLLHQHISPKWGRQRRAGLRSQGMRNRTHVLCYRHSGLQGLLHVPKFVNWLEQEHTRARCTVKACLACAFRCLSERYWAETDSVAEYAAAQHAGAIDACLRSIEVLSDHLGWYQTHQKGEQQDADEYISWALQTMLDQLPEAAANTLSSLFTTRTSSTITCESCKHTGKPEDPTELALRISVPLPSTKLATYISTHLHETITNYKCESCSCTADKPKVSTFTTSPPILLIQQKRFTLTSTASGDYVGRKLYHRVPFAEWLDLSRHSTSAAQRTAGSVRYRLTGVVDHLGGMEGGHYKAVVKGPDARWREMNDERVREVKIGEAMNPSGSWTPYILFYERVEREVADV